MRFGLIGDHRHGLELTSALVESGRHTLASYSTQVEPRWSDRWPGANLVPDAEAILADPAIDAVIVAGPLTARAEQLRRALQSERQVFCVYPPDEKPDIGYEASLIQKDTGFRVLPAVADFLHPGIDRFRELAALADGSTNKSTLLEVEWYTEGVSIPEYEEGNRGSFPIWFVLRALGGSILEVAAFSPTEEVRGDAPILLQGLYESGLLFRVTLLPNQGRAERRFRAVAPEAATELYFPSGFEQSAYLTRESTLGESEFETWPSWDSWQTYVAELELLTEKKPSRAPTWEDCLHALELDDAARRGIMNRRSVTMEYPDATEEISFKGTMVLAGCAVLWSGVFILFASIWVEWVRWLIVPLVVGYLLLQSLRYIIPDEKPTES